MNDVIQEVFDFSKEILAKEQKHVILNDEKIIDLGNLMGEDDAPSFYEKEQDYKTGIRNTIIKELIASSINYNYWYGASDLRPNNVSSSTMYADVNACFDDNGALNFNKRINALIATLSAHRYPLLEQRKRHLLELCEDRKAEHFCEMVQNRNYTGNRLFIELVEMFPGFASDIFLKRASLFFIQLYRKFGWWKDDLMTILHVPADYQVPKILRYFGCIEYSKELSDKIEKGELITRWSLEELQIRAATIMACTQLQYKVGWTIADVDTYLWTKRKLTDSPFHLTYTSDY